MTRARVPPLTLADRLTGPSRRLRLRVNGVRTTAVVETRTMLASFLREALGLIGVHVGCDSTHCGACAVLLDGRPVKSCTLLAVQVEGRSVETVEGLEAEGRLHPIQEAFLAEQGLQCGFCTPGMLLTCAAMIERPEDLTEASIREGLAGNLCRCTGYVGIVRAVERAAAAGRRKRIS